jgi:hypothetical protein
LSDRVPNPPSSRIVSRLLKDGSDTETEDVMALVGYVGPGRDGDVRLYPDLDFHRWMDFRREDIVDSSPLDAGPAGLEGRTVVWVRRASMLDPVFKPESLEDFEDDFAGSWMSTWPLIPETRLVAAEILDLIPRLSYGEERESPFR